MKSIAMLVAATAAVLAVNTSGALSQDACLKGYSACMDVCASRPTKGTQEPCITSCQSKNNQCSEQVYGARREINPPSPQASKALAKEAAPPPRKVDVAPRKAEGHPLRKVDVPPRRKAEGPAQHKAPAPAQEQQAPAAAPAPAEPQK